MNEIINLAKVYQRLVLQEFNKRGIKMSKGRQEDIIYQAQQAVVEKIGYDNIDNVLDKVFILSGRKDHFKGTFDDLVEFIRNRKVHYKIAWLFDSIRLFYVNDGGQNVEIA